MWTKTNCGSASDQSRNHSWDLRREIACPPLMPSLQPPPPSTPHTLFLIRLQIALRYFLRLPLWLPHRMVQLPVTVTVQKCRPWVHQCIGCRASDHNQSGEGLTKSLCTKTQSTSPIPWVGKGSGEMEANDFNKCVSNFAWSSVH